VSRRLKTHFQSLGVGLDVVSTWLSTNYIAGAVAVEVFVKKLCVGDSKQRS